MIKARFGVACLLFCRGINQSARCWILWLCKMRGTLLQSFFVTSQITLVALREHRPLWPRQIITSICPLQKMLSLGGERPTLPLPSPQKSFGLLPALRSGYATAIMLFFCSFTHLRIFRSPPKFNQFFFVLPRTPP